MEAGEVHYLEGGEMDDAVDGRVLLEDGVKGGLIGHVDVVEGGALPAEELHAVEGHDGRVVQVVDDDDIVAVLEEREGREGPDVAGATRVSPALARAALNGRREGRESAYPVTRTVPTAMFVSLEREVPGNRLSCFARRRYGSIERASYRQESKEMGGLEELHNDCRPRECARGNLGGEATKER